MKGHEDLARVEELKYLGHGPVAATSFWQMTNKGRDKADQNGQYRRKKKVILVPSFAATLFRIWQSKVS